MVKVSVQCEAEYFDGRTVNDTIELSIDENDASFVCPNEDKPLVLDCDTCDESSTEDCPVWKIAHDAEEKFCEMYGYDYQSFCSEKHIVIEDNVDSEEEVVEVEVSPTME